MPVAAPLILVVGMHRSGTSLLGSLLPSCGIAMPGPLLAGDVHNLEGYFERSDITALQEQLLIDHERWWPSPRGMEALPGNWLASALGQRALQNLTDLLEAERNKQTAPWAIKDPRSSLLLPLWKAACHKLNIPLQLLLAVRDPAEVCTSLIHRDRASTGMDLWRAQRLWWHHNAQVLREGQGLPLQIVSYSRWFEAQAAHAQLQRLAPHLTCSEIEQALRAIKPQHRRSDSGITATQLAPKVLAFHQRLDALAPTPAEQLSHERARLLRWLNHQQELPADAPLTKRRSKLKRLLKQQLLDRKQPLHMHPWRTVAEVACGSWGLDAENIIRNWVAHGFHPIELERFAALAGAAPRAQPWPREQGNKRIRIATRGADRWWSHTWLNRCPVSHGETIETVELHAAAAESVALNLADLEEGPACAAELLALARMDQVWDPSAKRVSQLRWLGVNAFWLTADAPANGYLAASQLQNSTLGLPAPNILPELGSSLCLGSSNHLLDQNLQSPLLGIPEFDRFSLDASNHAKQVGLWLQLCVNAGINLIRLKPASLEISQLAWQSLLLPEIKEKTQILLFQQPIGAEELLSELQWYQAGCPAPKPCATPQPQFRTIFEQKHQQPQLGICISLHNYADCILNALNSALQQGNAASIELIVVDDASTDDGCGVVEQWMNKQHASFARCLLLQHSNNGGLASARNTAFESAQSDWCFVLDADNTLEPMAAEHCAIVASEADAQCAVVHSLVRVVPSPNSDDQRHLISGLPWLKHYLTAGNYIDAMALVRRSAWADVGGYTHIPGGWEDFDFWCCLIDAGWHGTLCPEVLATYNSHGNSMRTTNTMRQERHLARILEQRHPWLELAYGSDQSLNTKKAAKALPRG